MYRRRALNAIRTGTITERIAGYLSLLNLVIILIILYEVISRYAFNSPTIWASEIGQQAFALTVLLGGAYTFRKGGFISISIFYDRFGYRARAVADIFTLLCISIFCFVLLWKGGEIALESVQIQEGSSTYWNPPIYHLRVALPLGALVLWLEGIMGLIPKITRGWKKRYVEVRNSEQRGL